MLYEIIRYILERRVYYRKDETKLHGFQNNLTVIYICLVTT